jgi:hypothetical protein
MTAPVLRSTTDTVPYWVPTAAGRPAGLTASAVTGPVTLIRRCTARAGPSTITCPVAVPSSTAPPGEAAAACTPAGTATPVPKPRRPVRSQEATVPSWATV